MLKNKVECFVVLQKVIPFLENLDIENTTKASLIFRHVINCIQKCSISDTICFTPFRAESSDLTEYMNPFLIVDEMVLPNRTYADKLTIKLSSLNLSLVYLNATVGWGLYSQSVIGNGVQIIPYYGEFISSIEARRRQLLYDKEVCCLNDAISCS